MFYKPGETDHGLPFNPFKACVVPRPIGWISTVSPTLPGQEPIYNLAPYSQFNNLTFDPPYVMFASNQMTCDPNTTSPTGLRSPGFERKDTVHNVESTGYFCWQLATYPLREAVNISAKTVPYTVDEFEECSLEKEWSTSLPIKIPMVRDSPVKFECKYYTTLRLPGNPPMGMVDVVIGQVVGVHINEKYLSKDGKLDPALTQPIARLGYYDYCVVKDTFEMVIPAAGNSQDLLNGLAGSSEKNRERHDEMQGKLIENKTEEAVEETDKSADK